MFKGVLRFEEFAESITEKESWYECFDDNSLIQA